MSTAARPLSSLLSAGAVVALTLAAPGTALADPAHGAGSQQGPGGAAASGADGKRPAADKGKGSTSQDGTAKGEPARPAAGEAGRGNPGASKPGATSSTPSQKKPAKQQRTATTADTAPQPVTTGSGDPAGNNGTIKIGTVPGDPTRANRPQPGCAFVMQFFGFDADQHADITFTGQAPTRSSGALLTLGDQLISTSPADGALEEGHSLTLTAADLGLLETPTAANGWHVKVAVDALEAPGGAKQKVFWLDCSTGEAAVEQEPDEADVSAAGAAQELETPSVVEQAAADRRLSGVADEVAVLSETADREAAVAGRAVDGAAVRAQDAGQDVAQGQSTTSTLASVLPFAVPAALPFTGAAGVAGMLVAGLGAVAAGALALRAGRRRTTG